MGLTYRQISEIAESARSPFNGKPFGNNTRVIDMDSFIVIRHHSTDILRFYPDGSLEVYTGWKSNSTIARIREFGGLNIQTFRLPSVNGRRPSREREMCLSADVTAPFYAANDYIRLNPERKIDLNTVKVRDVQIITDPSLVSKVRAKAKKIYQQVVLREKLGVAGNPAIDSWAWLKARIDTPLNEIDYSNMPRSYAITGSVFYFAAWVGAVDTLQFKTLEDFSRPEI